MNSSLLQAAKVVLENQTPLSDKAPLVALWSMGYVHFNTESAEKFLHQSVDQIPESLPLQGVALQHLYQCSKDKKAAKAVMQVLYPKILEWHRQLYAQHDPDEEGLPYTSDKDMQDPLFLALLVWSNENLIQIGHTLQEDVLEIIQWNELTIYSMNEKLWNAEQRAYLAYDRNADDFVQLDFTRIFAPLVGEIPTQEQAERIFTSIKRFYAKAERVNVFEQWLLRRGLLRYDFTEMATQIRQRLLQLVKEHGFYENFDLKSGKPMQAAKGQSALTAALIIDLLKRA